MALKRADSATDEWISLYPVTSRSNHNECRADSRQRQHFTVAVPAARQSIVAIALMVQAIMRRNLAAATRIKRDGFNKINRNDLYVLKLLARLP